MRITRGHSQPGRRPTQEAHRQIPLTGAPEAADWSEIEEEIAAAEIVAAANAEAENTAAENAETENDIAESDTEMTTSGTAPPMTS
jgi:hypothetical protein